MKTMTGYLRLMVKIQAIIVFLIQWMLPSTLMETFMLQPVIQTLSKCFPKKVLYGNPKCPVGIVIDDEGYSLVTEGDGNCLSIYDLATGKKREFLKIMFLSNAFCCIIALFCTISVSLSI